MSRQQIFVRMAAPMIAAAALLLSGCGSTIDGTPTAATDVVSATTSAKPTTTSKSPGGKSGGSTTTPRSGGRTDFQASIGDCVKLGGTQDDATIEKATCGSANSNFKVVAKARNSDACSADTDQAYYETLNGIETGAICLEIDWVVGECMELDNIAQRITCSTPGTIEGVKVLEILTGSTDVNDCKNGDRGYVYEERRKVVCVQSL